MRFKAAILVEQDKPLVIDELEAPVLDVGQVLVRVYASGICGAQLAEISGAKGPDPYLPHLLGHEGGAEVIEIGPGVKKVKVGDRVVMHWRKSSGIEADPPRYKLVGSDRTVGGGWVTTFNEMAIVSENRLTVIEKDVPMWIAALMGCAVTTALGLINNEAKIKIGESVIIAGIGGVGFNILQGAVLAGAEPIIGVDRHQGKIDHAWRGKIRNFSLFNTNGNWEVEARKIVGLRGADVFIDCTGSPEIIQAGYNMILPAGGRLVLVGQPHHSCDLTLPNFRKHYCGKVVLDSQGGLTDPERDIPRYLKLFYSGRLNLGQCVTHTSSLDKINEAIRKIQTEDVIRWMITMD